VQNYRDIRIQLGGDDKPPWFVIHRRDVILAIIVREDLNPCINANPAEVWVGAEEPLPEWGKRLAFQTIEVPLYVSPGERMGYSERGIFKIVANTDDATEIAAREAKLGTGKLSRIVFLEKTN
jgi:hypothetical protein